MTAPYPARVPRVRSRDRASRVVGIRMPERRSNQQTSSLMRAAVCEPTPPPSPRLVVGACKGQPRSSVPGAEGETAGIRRDSQTPAGPTLRLLPDRGRGRCMPRNRLEWLKIWLAALDDFRNWLIEEAA
jgi:hypothetical protein